MPPKNIDSENAGGSMEPEAQLARTTSMKVNEQISTTGVKEQEDGNDVDVTEETLEHIARGTVYAALAITDDKPDTLKTTGKVHPWQVEAIKTITGGNEELSHSGLTTILKETMDLELLCHIDASGVTVGGHFLDTQGYIAYNENYIVLSYRCTTSAFDWLANFNATASIWEPNEDLDLGYSGFCSGFEGYCCADRQKPRVHTGFYNNFLTSLRLIKEHINPLLQPDEPTRTLYVTGHSLGGGVATLATCYFLLEFDWDAIPHRFVSVTAGSPRALGKSMKAEIDERLETFQDKSKIELLRVVRGKDVVATVPPSILGFSHIAPPVKIEKDGRIVLKTSYKQQDTEARALKELALHKPAPKHENDSESVGEKTRYEKMVSSVPRALRDHMPDLYLKPLFQAAAVSEARELDHPSRKESDYGKDPPGVRRLLLLRKRQAHPAKCQDEGDTKAKKVGRKRKWRNLFRRHNKEEAHPHD